jgi:hypothetical protein
VSTSATVTWLQSLQINAQSADPEIAAKARAELGLVVPFRAWFMREQSAGLTPETYEAFNCALGIALAGFIDAVPLADGWSPERTLELHLAVIRERALATLAEWQADERGEQHGSARSTPSGAT